MGPSGYPGGVSSNVAGKSHGKSIEHPPYFEGLNEKIILPSGHI